MQMLITNESEKLVLENRAAQFAARGVAMQLRILVGSRDVVVLLEEEGSGIDPVVATMQLCAAM